MNSVVLPPFSARVRSVCQLFLACAFGALVPAAFAQIRTPLDLRDGDRVLLLGDTLIEREAAHDYVEARLTAQFPGRNVTFRNLGWSADTVRGQSRASFDHVKPDQGFPHLTNQIAAVQPTVVIMGYGMAHSFDGAAGLEKFKTDYNALMDTIQSLVTNATVRFVLLGPTRHENLGAPLPDPAPHNAQLELYTEAIREIAAQRKCHFVSLYALLTDGTKAHPPRPLTDNGIHLTRFGYLRMAEALEQGVYWEPNFWRIGIDAAGRVASGTYGTTVSDVNRTTEGLRFTALDTQLVNPQLWEGGKPVVSRTAPCLVQIEGLARGRYDLKIDGAVVATGTERDWHRGVAIERGPQFDQAEQLRQTILRKNELHFHRWRPQNETYLFGFRKYEQGQNAAEVPQFDPLVDEQEKIIARLRQPVMHQFELVLAGKTVAKKSSPEKARKKSDGSTPLPEPETKQPVPEFEVAEGFSVNLFAESPLLAKPIQMNFDPQGRLWIVSSSVYPQIQPGQAAEDKVLILEDSNRDGRADRSTVFADGLLIPTGIEPGDGGAYVAQSTELLHFTDTDGDGRADTRRVVLAAFGTEDTHHMLHTLRWGFDGRLYMNQSIYIHSHIETPHGVVRLNSGGVFGFRPPTMELDVFVRGFVNTWGHDFDRFGQSFLTDGAGSDGINYGLPGAMYFTYSGARRILGGISPGSYPKFCGIELVHSSHFPDDWQGNAITCDFRAHRVVRFAIEEKDSAFVTRELPDVLRSTNVTFRPIDVKLGPDGALYIADWANPIIQHGEVDFRDPRRDHEHGRIWRVTAKDRPLVKKQNLADASNRALLDTLLSRDEFNRRQARRVLTERGADISRDLARWTRRQKEEFALLEALWMYQCIDAPEPVLFGKLLDARDHRVRAAAVRVLGAWHERVANPVDLLAKRVADEHPRVRLEAARALARIPSGRSAELVLGALDRPMDSFLDYALWLSINDLAAPWVAAIESGEWRADGRENQLAFGLKAIEPALAAKALAKVLENKTIPADGSGPWIELIGQAGSERELLRLFDQVLAGGFNTSASAKAVKALELAARTRNARPSGDLKSVGKLLDHSNAGLRLESVRLAGAWRLRSVVPQLLRFVADETDPQPLRKAAFESLRNIGGRDVVAGLIPLTDKARPPAIRQEAVVVLAALDLSQAKSAAIEVLSDTGDEAQSLELWRSLLNVKGAAKELAQALPRTGLPPVMAKTGLKAAREGGRNEPELVMALSIGSDADAAARELTAAEVEQLVARVKTDGDPARGERIYRRLELACVNCHAIGGVGGKLGPDLTSIGASAPVDYLIESILYPNRKVKEGYHSIVIETKDGEEFSGILARETDDQLIVRNALDQEVAVAKDNVARRAPGNSLMPAGLADALSAQERLDLFRFLTELGKPGPFDASRGNVARSWKLFVATIDIAQFGDDKVLATPLTDDQWEPSAALVDGRLPRDEMAKALDALRQRDPKAIYAATRVEVPKAGLVRFTVSLPPAAPLWIGGKLFAHASGMETELTQGVHVIVTKLEAGALPDSIRIETNEGTFLKP